MNENLNKIRLILFTTTIGVVIGFATLFGFYARGYRFDQKNGITPHGLLVAKSDPDGAQVYVDGVLKAITADNISLVPGEYDVEIRKEGFQTWKKHLSIEKEIVTEFEANLFKSAPSLTAITLSGVQNTIPSRDMAKIAFVVPVNTVTDPKGEKSGLWIMETINLPLGFSREPMRITDGNLSNATWIWSPDGQEIMLKLDRGTYLIPTNRFTSQSQLINLASEEKQIITEWDEELAKKQEAETRKLPDEVVNLLNNKASQFVFSPDEDMILYVASGSATLKDNLNKPYPGASTQKEEREIKDKHTYVYDIEEDKNFLIDESSENLLIEGGYSLPEKTRRINWFPTSRNLVLAEENKVIIMDYDGTNRQTVYAGNYIFPNAFPTVSEDRIMLLTNFGSIDTLPNLYSVSLK